MRETWEEQLDRVRLMASGDSTWDLSENDIAALKAVLDELDTDDTNVRTVASECRKNDEARISVLEDALRMYRSQMSNPVRKKMDQHCAFCFEVGVSYVKTKGGFHKLCDSCWKLVDEAGLTVPCDIVRAI